MRIWKRVALVPFRFQFNCAEGLIWYTYSPGLTQNVTVKICPAIKHSSWDYSGYQVLYNEVVFKAKMKVPFPLLSTAASFVQWLCCRSAEFVYTLLLCSCTPQCHKVCHGSGSNSTMGGLEGQEQCLNWATRMAFWQITPFALFLRGSTFVLSTTNDTPLKNKQGDPAKQATTKCMKKVYGWY